MNIARQILIASLCLLSVARAANFVVTNTLTSGAGSMTQAILDANANAGADTISINIGTGVQTIVFSTGTQVPAITEEVTIDGTTQPGYAGTPLIELNGNGRDLAGIIVSGTAANCTFKGLILYGFGKSSSPTVVGDAMRLGGAGGHHVENCWFGFNSAGTRFSNRGDDILVTSPNCVIGGATADKRCVISGATTQTIATVTSGGNGVHCTTGATNCTVDNCYIGTNVAGDTAVGCFGDGVHCDSAATCLVQRCVISGNTGDGIECNGAGACQVRACTIGLKADGGTALANGGNGVRCVDSPDFLCGGANADDANTICCQSSAGISCTGSATTNCRIQRNYIGTNAMSAMGLGNGGGIFVQGATGVKIGGINLGNYICGGATLNPGVSLSSGADNAEVRGNFVGQNPDGSLNGTGKGGGSGIAINNASNCKIGGSLTGEGNVIVDNGKIALVNLGAGIELVAGTATGNIIRGNWIGTDASMTLHGGNARAGVFIQNAGALVANGNTLGGPNAADGNVIAFNHGGGLTDYGGSIFVLNNRFIQNDGLPIDLVAGDNEGQDTPTVPGTLMNKVVVTKAETGSLRVVGQLVGMATLTTHIVAMAIAAQHADAEFEENVGTFQVTTDANGNANFDVTIAYAALAGQILSCYAIRQDGSLYPTEITTGVVVEQGAGGGTGGATSAGNPNFTTAGDPVNTRNGELLALESVDLNLGGPLPLTFARYYASKLSADGKVTSAMGKNRSHNFDSKLTLADTTHAEVVLSSGRVVPFVKDTKGKWAQGGRLDVPFQLIEDGGAFRFAAKGATMQHVFDAAGKLTSITDGHGNTLSLAYGADGPAAVTDGLGRTLTFSYTGGKLTSVGDGTRTVTFAYTGNNLTSATDPQSHVTTYAYDGSGNLTGVTRPAGNTPINQTFTSGKVTTQTMRSANTTLAYNTNSTVETDPANATLTHGYDANGNLASLTDAAGKSIVTTADTAGRRNSVTDRLGRKTTIVYDAASGLPSKVTRPDGRSTLMLYKARLQNGLTFFDLVKITHADGSGESFTYDTNGNVLTSTDELGRKKKFTYNANGQPLTITNAAGGIVTLTYDNKGRVATIRDSDTQPVTFTYDTLDRVTKVTHPDAAHRDYAYTPANRLDVATDERGSATDFNYDNNDRLTGITDAAGKSATVAYDTSDTPTGFTDRRGKTSTQSYSNRSLVSTTTNALGKSTTLGYDSRRRFTSVTDATARAVALGYDEEARLTSVTDALNHTTRIARDPLGLVRAVSDALGDTAEVARDARLRPVVFTDAIGRQTKWTRDKAGQITASARDGGIAAKFTRDLLGNITSATEPNGGVWKFTYTKMGRLLTSTDPLARKTSYTYDTRGRVATIAHPDGVTVFIVRDAAGLITGFTSSGGGASRTFTRDALGRVVTADGVGFTRNEEGWITDNVQNGKHFAAAYDDAGRIAQSTLAGAVTVNYTYDDAGRLLTVGDTTTNTAVTFSYDAAGRMAGITRNGSAPATTFTRDAANRVTRIQHGSLVDLKYTLNAAGEVRACDMTAPTLPGVAADARTFKFDKSGQLVSTTSGAKTDAFTYDARGRLTNAPRTKYSWDAFSRLVEIDAPGQNDDRTFTYNGLGNLVTRTVGRTNNPSARTRYYYHHALRHDPIVAEFDDLANTATRYYVTTPGGRLLYSIDAGTGAVHYYLADRSGSVLALTNAAGVVTDSYAYGLYGEPLGRTGSSDQPFRWLGEWGIRTDVLGTPANEDTPTLALHIRARWLDPVTGRFLSRDPARPRPADPRTLDRYAYGFGDPATYIDITGREPEAADQLLMQWGFDGASYVCGLRQRTYARSKEANENGEVEFNHSDPDQPTVTSRDEFLSACDYFDKIDAECPIEFSRGMTACKSDLPDNFTSNQLSAGIGINIVSKNSGPKVASDFLRGIKTPAVNIAGYSSDPTDRKIYAPGANHELYADPVTISDAVSLGSSIPDVVENAVVELTQYDPDSSLVAGKSRKELLKLRDEYRQKAFPLLDIGDSGAHYLEQLDLINEALDAVPE